MEAAPSQTRPAPSRRDGWVALRDYAAIGDQRTLALVARDGSVDWLCLPELDGEMAFAALLDPDGGGSFALAPAVPFRVGRRYEPDTNLLETTFATAHGTVQVLDAFTSPSSDVSRRSELVRAVRCLDGEVPLRWRVELRRAAPGREPPRRGASATLLALGDVELALQCWGAGEPRLDAHGAGGETTLRAGERALLSLAWAQRSPLMLSRPPAVEQRLDAARAGWRAFAARCVHDGPWREPVVRSALALALLFRRRTGAMAAAATTSLPEAIGGERNYDYRFAWLRDSDFALDALLSLELREEVAAALTWALRTSARTHPRLRPFSTLDGEAPPPERTLPLPGWRGCGPVRAGNSAVGQLQLGTYGQLLNTVWHFVSDGHLLDRGSAVRLAELADFVCAVWRRDDSGIWELPHARPHTYSKIGCWLALDRAARMADAGVLPAGGAARWRREAAAIERFVGARCWSRRAGAFAAAAGADDLDAAVLQAGRLGFLDGEDPRLEATIDAVVRELGAGGPLLWRTSALRGREGAFVACSFWLVEALVAAGRREEAEEAFAAAAALADDDVGLLAEEVDPADGAFLGNLPQALSHLSLISAAQSLAQTRPAPPRGARFER